MPTPLPPDPDPKLSTRPSGPAEGALPSTGSPASAELGLDVVRDELRRLGYLSHRFDRYLLQDALRPRHGLGQLVRLAARVALLSGVPLALFSALFLLVANGGLLAAPFDLVALTLHLLVPFAAAAFAVTFLLCAAITGLLRWRPIHRVEPLSLTAATLVGVLGLGLVAWFGRGVIANAGTAERVALAVGLPLAAGGLVRLLYEALLSLVIQLTTLAPRERFGRPLRFVALAALLLAAAAGLLALVGPRPLPLAGPPFLPSQPGEPVLLIGIDGVLASELEYLLALGDLPVLSRLLAAGGALATYQRVEQPAAAFWTSVATGLPAPAHGVASFDSFRPRGASVALARNGPLRVWWTAVAVPLGLAENRAVLASRRRAYTVWELAARGGSPVVAVNWWSTWPAEPLAGAVVAHGAHQLMRGDPVASIAPERWRAPLSALAAELVDGPAAGPNASSPASLAAEGEREAAASPPRASNSPLAALPAAVATAIDQRALAPDRFYRAAARWLDQAIGSPSLVAVYLPALDLAADGWAASDVAFADLVRQELIAVDQLVGELAADGGTVVLVADPGRRRDGSGGGASRIDGRVMVWRASGCRAAPGPVASESLAAAMLAVLGLAQSSELAPAPALCDWPRPPAVVPTFGERVPRPTATEVGEEYLRNLESLGYL